MDTALWERGRTLLAAKLAEQREAGILEEMPSSEDDTWALQRLQAMRIAAVDNEFRHVLMPCFRRSVRSAGMHAGDAARCLLQGRSWSQQVTGPCQMSSRGAVAEGVACCWLLLNAGPAPW